MKKILVLALLIPLFLAGCSKSSQEPEESRNGQAATPSSPPVASVPRWYTEEQVKRGYPLFQQHSAECHKPDASGDPNWKQVDAEGKLPPPPLNGTAHAWHHPLPLLRRIVREGGIPMGGSMPPFKDKLDSKQIDDILAWVQSHWSDQIYATWNKINQRKKP